MIFQTTTKTTVVNTTPYFLASSISWIASSNVCLFSLKGHSFKQCIDNYIHSRTCMINLGQINFRGSTDKELMNGDYSWLQHIVKGLAVYKIKQGFFYEVLTLWVIFVIGWGFTKALCSNVSLTPRKAEELCVPITNRHCLYL